jgi:chloramphenicol-sensitive protein RarD
LVLQRNPMTEATKGFWALVLACTIWGLSPLYYKLLVHVPPLEVLSHRTLWSLAFFLLVLAAKGQIGALRPALSGRRMLAVALASLMISANWFVFIWAVQQGRAIEASLGYFIFPLVAVLIGVFALGERLGRLQAAAVLLAFGAVSVLTWGLGSAPWIALTLAFSFGLYGLIKNRLNIAPVVSVTAEVLLLAPVAVIWLAGVHQGFWAGARSGASFGVDLTTSLLLAFSGVLTAGPLMLFSYAARRVRMATVGLVQYLNPSLQFFCAVVIFGEPFSPWHRIAFSLIWLALLIYGAARLSQPKAVPSADSSDQTSGTLVR